MRAHGAGYTGPNPQGHKVLKSHHGKDSMIGPSYKTGGPSVGEGLARGYDPDEGYDGGGEGDCHCDPANTVRED